MAMEMRRTVIVRDFAIEYFVSVLENRGRNTQRTFLCHLVYLEWISSLGLVVVSIGQSRRPRNCSSRR